MTRDWRWQIPAALAAAALFVAITGAVYPNGDARIHVMWGDLLLHAQIPEFSGIAPAKHPLILMITTPLAIGGQDFALFAIETLSVFWLILLLYGLYRLGRAIASPLAGAIAIAIALTVPELVKQALVVGKDLPFLALSMVALALAVEKPRENWIWAMGLFAAAGLIRPEAWALAGLYGLWLLWLGVPDGVRRWHVIAAVAVAPLLWFGIDTVLTGDPKHTISQERNKPEHVRAAGFETDDARELPVFDRLGDELERGISETIDWPLFALGILGAVAGMGFAARAPGMAGRDWFAVAVAIVIVGYGFTFVLAVLELPFVPRFLLFPGLVVIALGAYLLTNARNVPAPLVAGAAACLVLWAINVPDDLREIDSVVDRNSDLERRVDSLVEFTERDEIRTAAERCDEFSALGNSLTTARFIQNVVALSYGIDPQEAAAVAKARARDGSSVFASKVPQARMRAGDEPARTEQREGPWLFASSC